MPSQRGKSSPSSALRGIKACVCNSSSAPAFLGRPGRRELIYFETGGKFGPAGFERELYCGRPVAFSSCPWEGAATPRPMLPIRSEERRVGKEGGCRWARVV